MTLFWKCKAIMRDRGFVPDDGPFRVTDFMDGKGLILEIWSESVFGPKPTQAQLDAADGAREEHLTIWENEMAAVTRDMPDCVEAVIDSMDEAQLYRLDQAAKDQLAAKKTVRETKPEVPE